MPDDILLGMSFLRTNGTSIHISREGRESEDYLRFHTSTERVPILHEPSGICTGVVALVATASTSVPPRSGKPIEVTLKGQHARPWPKNRELEGILVPALVGGYHQLFPSNQTVTFDPGGNAIIDVRNLNTVAKDVKSGQIVAYLDPHVLQSRVDSEGKRYVYQHHLGGFATMIDARKPGQPAVHTTPLGWDPVPVATVEPKTAIRNLKVTVLSKQERESLREQQKLDQAVEEKVEKGATLPEYKYSDVYINPSLSISDKRLVRQLVEDKKIFFSPITSAYPNTKIPSHLALDIRLKDNPPPWRFRAYPLNPGKRKAMEEIIKKQLAKGMIRHSCSPYALPAFLVGKASGGHRMVIDARKLNKHIEKSSYPLPRIQDIMDRLGGYEFFNSIDLADGFHQVPISEDSRKYTAFVTETGLYEENTVPMGLATAPNHFQYVVNRLLNGTALMPHPRESGTTKNPTASSTIAWDGVEEGHDLFENLLLSHAFVYIDDVLVCGKTLEESLDNLRKVIDRLLYFGLRGKAPKCKLGMTELKFLGTIISAQGKRPDPKKIKAIMEIESPHQDKKPSRAKTRLMAFLGLAGFYRHHIPNFALITDPLNRLLEKGRVVTRDWGDEHTRAFNALKQAFVSAPVLLAHIDWSKPFSLVTDASKTHIGGVLQQLDDQGLPAVVAYYSRALTKRERKYHMTHLEALAVVACVKNWDQYLLMPGTHTIHTDHQALQWLRENRYADSTHRVARWFAYLDSFDTSLHFVSGTRNGAADAMTRMWEEEEDIFEWKPSRDYTEQYRTLARYLPASVTHVEEIQYTNSPSGGEVFTEKGFLWKSLEEENLNGRRGHNEHTVLIAAPPPGRDKSKILFRYLRRNVPKWAVWCPLGVLHSSAFREPDFQILVAQGCQGSGAHKGALPSRGVWVTHGLLNGNILKPRDGDLTSHTELVRACSLMTARADWTRWQGNSRPFADHADGFLHSEQPITPADADSAFDKVVAMSLRAAQPPSSAERIAPRQQFWERVHHIVGDTCGCETPALNRLFQISPQEGDRFALSKTALSELRRMAQTREGAHKPPSKPSYSFGDDAFLEVVRKLLEDDPLGTDIRKKLREQESQRGETLVSEHYVETDGLLYLVDVASGQERLYVPAALRLHILHMVHQSSYFQHPGMTKMYSTLRRDLYWPHMRKHIEDYVARCHTCAKAKAPQPHRQGHTSILIPDRPFQVVGIDYYGPLPETTSADASDSGYRYIVTIVDHFSRWVRLVPLKEDPTAHSLASVFTNHWIRHFGVPELLVSDQGSEFTSRLLQDVGNLLGMRVYAVPTETQWRNGRVERVHRYLGHRIRSWCNERHAEWHTVLPFVEMSHHFTEVTGLGRSPYEILYGRAPRLPFLMRSHTSPYWGSARLFVASFHDKLRQVREEIKREENKLSEKRVAERRARQKPLQLSIGDLVILFTKGQKNKTQYLWSDEVRVTALPSQTTVHVTYPSGQSETVPLERVRRVPSPWDAEALSFGPLQPRYPHAVLNGGISPARQKGNLPTWRASFPVVTSVTGVTTGREVKRQTTLIEYGDYIVHLCSPDRHPAGWTVSQYLGYNECHGEEVHEEALCLRRCNRIRGTPPRGPYYYEWYAERGRRNVVSSRPTTRDDPDIPPRDKASGELATLWEHIHPKDLLAIVHLTGARKISNDSWTRVLHVASMLGMDLDMFVS